MVLEKQLVLHTYVEVVIKQFPNNVEFNILQWESLTNGKPSRQLLASPGADVPASSPQSQTVQWSENYKKPKSYISTPHVSMSLFNVRVNDSTEQHKRLLPTIKHSSGGGDDLGLCCSHRTWVPCSYRVDHECLSEAWLILALTTGQRSEAHQ